MMNDDVGYDYDKMMMIMMMVMILIYFICFVEY